MNNFEHLGQIVTVTVDRPLGTFHPEHKELFYPVNYGYVEGVVGGDGEWQDAYILGIDKAIESFCGQVVAVIVRRNDNETKWVVAPESLHLTVEDIRRQTHFQEKFFDTEIIVKG